MEEFRFEVGRRVYGWVVDVISIEAETAEEALERLKETVEDATVNGWDEDDVKIETSEFDCHSVEYPTVEENGGMTIYASHLDSDLGWNNEEE